MSYTDDLERWRSGLNANSRITTPYLSSLNDVEPSTLTQTDATPNKWDLGKAFKAIPAALGDVFTPKTEGTEGLPYWERAISEYEAWDSPWGAKFALETIPYLAIPSAGGVIAKLAGTAAKRGVAGMAAKGVSTALKPVAAAENLAGAVVGGALKPLTGIAGKTVNKITESIKLRLPKIEDNKLILTTSKELDDAFKLDGPRRFSIWAEHKPLLGGIVKAMGGKGAFINPASTKLEDITAIELMKREMLLSQSDSVSTYFMSKLLKYGSPMKLLQVDTKGVVHAVKEKGTLTDVIENASKYTWTDPVARKYADDLVGILDDLKGLATKEGIKVSDAIKLHRVSVGKTTPIGYVKSETGAAFELERKYASQAEGVLNRIDYDFNPNNAVKLMVKHRIKTIADERLRLAMKPLVSRKSGLLGHGENWTDVNKAFRRDVYIRNKKTGEVTKSTQKLIFPKEVVEVAEKYLKDEGNAWLAKTSRLSGFLRLLTAAMDVSAPLIQGLPALGRNPVAWGKGVYKMFSFIKPSNLYKYADDPATKKIVADRIRYGGTSATSEFYEALPEIQMGAEKLSKILKVPQAGKAANKIIEQTYGRAETMFTGFGEVTKNELWKAMRKEGMANAELRELAGTIDRMVGTMSSQAIGVGMTQRQFENGWLFFASRYTRAGLALTSDVLRGGMRGTEARKALAGLAGGGMAMYFGVCKAIGQEPNFNPTDSKFMTLQVGNDNIGVGGIMTAIARLTANVYATAKENPGDLISAFEGGRLNRWDNPFIKFMYSRTAPLTSLTFGAAVEKADYFGQPFETPGDWARFLADKVTPIALQRVAPWSEEEVSPVAVAGELTGMRTWGERKIYTYEQEKRQAYNKIEEDIWIGYPAEFSDLGTEINKLRNAGDMQGVNKILRQYPGLVVAMKTIAQKKKIWLLRNPEANRSSGSSI